MDNLKSTEHKGSFVTEILDARIEVNELDYTKRTLFTADQNMYTFINTLYHLPEKGVLITFISKWG